MNTLPKLQIKISVKSIGLFAGVLYYIFCYISCYEKIPSRLNSIFLYFFVGMGLIHFLLTKGSAFNKPYFKWYLSFMLFSLIGLPIAMIFAEVTGWFDTFYQMIVSLLICNSLMAFVDNAEDLKKIGKAHIVGAVALVGLLACAGQLHIDERLGTTATGNANIFASMYMIAAIYAVWIFTLSGTKSEKIFAFISWLIIMYALLLSGGRKFVIVPIVFLYIILIFKLDKYGKRHIAFYTLGVAAIVIGLYFLIMNVDILYRSIGYRMKYLINQITGNGQIGASNTLRSELRRLAFTEGWESPLFGHGFDSFKFIGRSKLNFFAYSHNNWTEMWYNGGIMGLVIYYSLYYKIVKRSWKIRKVNQTTALLGLAGIVSIFIFEYGGVDYYTYPIQSFICLISILVFAKEGEENHEQT